MYPIFGVPEVFEQLNQALKQEINKLFSKIPVYNERTLLGAQKTVFLDTGQSGMLYIIEEGIITYGYGEKTLYFYDTGDLIGLEQFLEKSFGGELKTDFAVLADEYRLSDLYEALKDPELAFQWNKIISLSNELTNILVLTSAQTKMEVDPETLTAKPGEIIIEQGSRGTDVFTLVEGHLEVLVDGVIVGEVMPDEIFGAMAALTETLRSATVRATEISVILKLPRERFLDLVKSRPLTVMKMIEDMSRTIISLNERVVELSGGLKQNF